MLSDKQCRRIIEWLESMPWWKDLPYSQGRSMIRRLINERVALKAEIKHLLEATNAKTK